MNYIANLLGSNSLPIKPKLDEILCHTFLKQNLNRNP